MDGQKIKFWWETDKVRIMSLEIYFWDQKILITQNSLQSSQFLSMSQLLLQ